VSVHYVNEAVFELPDLGFVDLTVHVLETMDPEDPFSITVLRKALGPDVDLATAVAAHVDHQGRAMSRHRVLARRDIELGGVPGLELEVSWRHGAEQRYQLQAHLDVAGIWLLVTGTAPLDRQAECAARMRVVLDSLRLRSDA
jgi:hypothetical protein